LALFGALGSLVYDPRDDLIGWQAYLHPFKQASATRARLPSTALVPWMHA
jgi:hypothetical protein